MLATRPNILNPFLKSIVGLSEDDFEEIIITDPHQFPETPTGKLGILDKVKIFFKMILTLWFYSNSNPDFIF
jgi:hypothetical protein